MSKTTLYVIPGAPEKRPPLFINRGETIVCTDDCPVEMFKDLNEIPNINLCDPDLINDNYLDMLMAGLIMHVANNNFDGHEQIKKNLQRFENRWHWDTPPDLRGKKVLIVGAGPSHKRWEEARNEYDCVFAVDRVANSLDLRSCDWAITLESRPLKLERLRHKTLASAHAHPHRCGRNTVYFAHFDDKGLPVHAPRVVSASHVSALGIRIADVCGARHIGVIGCDYVPGPEGYYAQVKEKEDERELSYTIPMTIDGRENVKTSTSAVAGRSEMASLGRVYHGHLRLVNHSDCGWHLGAYWEHTCLSQTTSSTTTPEMGDRTTTP